MKKVKFAIDYRHPKSDISATHYEAGRTYTVADEVAERAAKMDALESGSGSGKSAPKGGDDRAQG